TWAVNSNVNFGLVTDNGDPFDSPGAIQGDSRFGDVRIGARVLGPDVLALTTPFNYFNTSSGNVVVNSAVKFGQGGYDLFTALLQEAGHSLGVGNSSDLTSAMYENYQGPRAGLSAADVAALQGLYGARLADNLEGATGNDTTSTATDYSGP